MGINSEDKTSRVGHLADQKRVFNKLWACQPKHQQELVDLFWQLRDLIFEQRKQGRDTKLSEYARRLQPENCRALLSKGFKKSTSVGVCGVPLQRLKKLPDCASVPLAAIVLECICSTMGPSEGVHALLDLIPKKVKGCKRI